MYTRDNLNKIIIENISNLNFSWFSAKEVKFKEEKHYDAEHEIIILPVTDYDEIKPKYDKRGKFISSELKGLSYSIKIDLSRYCACYFPINEITNWGASPIDESIPRKRNPNNIDEFSSELVQEVIPFLKKGSQNVETHKFISYVLDIIEMELNKLKKAVSGNSMYVNVLDDYYKKCLVKLYTKYEPELTTYAITADYQSKLRFSLTQDQMLALIFIIQRAGFFDYNDSTHILQFSLNHFLYSDEGKKMVSPSSLKNLQKKYSDIAVSQNPRSRQVINHLGLNSVKEKLEEILRGLH